MSDTLPEKAVIGALLADVRVLRSVQAEVVPSDFFDQRLGAIYAGITRMVAEGEPVDYITVGDSLASWDVRGIDLMDLHRWSQAVPSALSAAYYAGMVRASALGRGLSQIAGRLGGDEDAGIRLTRGLEELRELRDRLAAGSAAAPLRLLREVLDVDASVDRYDWVVPGLLERRDRLMLTGSEGGGKSTLLRQIALMAASGLQPFTVEAVEPVSVLVVDAENSERQWRRAVRSLAADCALIGVGDPRDRLRVDFRSRLNLTSAADLGEVHRMIDVAQPDLLLIGPLYRLVPRAIKDDDDAAPVLAALDSLRERDVTLMIEAHAGHTQGAHGGRDLRPRGSSALLGWPEFGLGIAKPDKPGDPFRLLRWRGDRDERHWPTELTSKKLQAQRWPWEPTGSYLAHYTPATLV